MQLLFWKALVGLLAFDVLGYGSNFAKLHDVVSRSKVAPRMPSSTLVDQVCRAVNYACVVYPKRVLCLQRSAVTTCILRSCGVQAQMVLGAQKMPFQAHAWTEVNGHAINERTNVQETYGVWERC